MLKNSKRIGKVMSVVVVNSRTPSGLLQVLLVSQEQDVFLYGIDISEYS